MYKALLLLAISFFTSNMNAQSDLYIALGPQADITNGENLFLEKENFSQYGVGGSVSIPINHHFEVKPTVSYTIAQNNHSNTVQDFSPFIVFQNLKFLQVVPQINYYPSSVHSGFHFGIDAGFYNVTEEVNVESSPRFIVEYIPPKKNRMYFLTGTNIGYDLHLSKSLNILFQGGIRSDIFEEENSYIIPLSIQLAKKL